MLDRFDLRTVVSRPGPDELLADQSGEPTAVVRQRVAAARCFAQQRGHGPNGTLSAAVLDEVAPLSAAARAVVRAQLDRGVLSGRGLHRIRRVARTIADLRGGADVVDEEDVVMALHLRVDVSITAGRAA
jgi:magnesium chelatase family protein